MLGAGRTWTDTLYFTAPAALNELGGTLNWLDAAGQYMLVRYSSERSVHVYNRRNLGAGSYAKSDRRQQVRRSRSPRPARSRVEKGATQFLTSP